MKIIYYTTGLTGWGRIVTGISIVNAFKRANIKCEYTILSSFEPEFQFEGINHIKIPVEHEDVLLGNESRKSILYQTLSELKPDIILFDLLWHMTYNFIQDFTINLSDKKIIFDPDHFDFIFATEPFESRIEMRQINPIIIRNRDEIFSHEEAISRLKLKDDKELCLFAYNGKPGEYEAIKNKYMYLEDAGYRMIYSTNYEEKSFFPIVDYFNAFDFIVSGAGYNAFWEIIYFEKEAVFEPVPRNFENQYWRVENCQEYYFEENGADQLVDIIVNL